MWKWLILSGLALVIMYFYFNREHMTNSDLISTLKTFGDKGTKKSTKDTSKQESLPIMGPKAPAIDPADKKKKEASKGTNTSGVYPDIYGPDIPKIPGTTRTAGKHVSDETSDEIYEFNPNLKNAFPVEGPPQPFLTDFSKFQH
jgi:hypothetical protein